jgi:putative transcriptional regulator
MISQAKPKKGSLLLSEPFMLDPNFKRSVVLLTEHTNEGSIGYVLNHKSDMLLKDLLPECENADNIVFIGGPVANNTLHFIHRCYNRMNSGSEIGDGIYWGGNFETLKVLLKNNAIRPDEVKFFVGYSGWGSEQLKSEMSENSWLVANKYNAGLTFVENEDNLWKEVIIGLGPKYAHIANFPENPLWN